MESFIEHLSASIWAMVMRGIPNKQQTIAQSSPSFHAEIPILSVKNVRNGLPIVLPSDNEFSKIIDDVFIVCSDTPEGEFLTISDTSLTVANLHLYKLLNRDAQTLEAQSGEYGSESNTAGSLLWELPCCEFDGIWENLIFDDSIKDELLSYVYALVRLSEKNTNTTVLRVNRMILLHGIALHVAGPPGTGKTSLCRALAQKLAIRFSQKYKRIYFVEINSHGLFSKFFSESGKLIQSMFKQIEELAEDPKAFVFVLIDEVESLTIARSALLNRNEPTDAIRAVNAVLTQVDYIRRRSNIFIFTTSNITEARLLFFSKASKNDCIYEIYDCIYEKRNFLLQNFWILSLDEAFTDRTDLSRFVGYPSANAVYAIFRSCIQEMQRIGIVEPGPWFSERYASGPHCEKLMQLSRSASGLSGRCLRQLPVIGYSKLPVDQLSIEQCLGVLEKALKEKLSENVRCLPSDLNARRKITTASVG
uniref:AAA domain-containing protein n=1 Tax=Wuchereria bancrofti TaxID=6293 RepID=A0A1I8EYW3_WUCBA